MLRTGLTLPREAIAYVGGRKSFFLLSITDYFCGCCSESCFFLLTVEEDIRFSSTYRNLSDLLINFIMQ